MLLVVVVVVVVVVVLAVRVFVVEFVLAYILRMGSCCYPDASVSPIVFSPFPIFRFTRAIADAHLYPPPLPAWEGRDGGWATKHM